MGRNDVLDFPIYVDLEDGSEPALLELEGEGIVVEMVPAAPHDPRIAVLEGLLAQVRERKRARG